MEKKGVHFISKQTKIREFYGVGELEGRTFADVADELYKRLLLESTTIVKLMEERRNELHDEHRVGLIKFFYLSDGLETPISTSESVLRFYVDTGVNEVLFFVDVIGGEQQTIASLQEAEEYSHYQFLAHAKEVLQDPAAHGEWTLREFAPNRFRLIKTVQDRHRRSITVILQPNAGYPRRPPRVITIPRHRDPCFANGGELDWTVVASTRQFTWELYANHANPLVYLLDELKRKYRLVF